MKVVLIRCPQPELCNDDGDLYSPNRTRTPEPTLPQLNGILQDFSERLGTYIEVVQLDLRDPSLGTLKAVHYGDVHLPYISQELHKVYYGVPLESLGGQLAGADVVGFTNNFSMSRGVVTRQMQEIRTLLPGVELWVGGRDVYTERIKKVYIEAACSKNIVLFEGQVFESLPAYLRWKLCDKDKPFGVTIYDSNGQRCLIPPRSLLEFANERHEINVPIPIYPRPESLGYFAGSGEGEPNPPYGRFVYYMTSYGCPYACAYCTTGQRERFLVHKDEPTIIRELEMYKRLGTTTLAYDDDNLLALGPEKVNRFLGLVSQYGFEIEYGNGLQLSLLLKHWDEISNSVFCHCVSLYAPLEDLTQDRLYEKLDPIATQLELMRRIANTKFEVLKYVTMGAIVGVPGHTKQALTTTFMENTRRFLDVFIGSSYEIAMTVFNFIPLPGTSFGEKAFDSGRMVADAIHAHPEICNFGVVSYAPDGMTAGEVYNAQQAALELNPAGKALGISYNELQRKGERILPENERYKIPIQWRTPGKHLRAKMVVI